MYGQNNDGDHIREFEKFENKTIKILGFFVSSLLLSGLQSRVYIPDF